jgi:hypothetical protein
MKKLLVILLLAAGSMGCRLIPESPESTDMYVIKNINLIGKINLNAFDAAISGNYAFIVGDALWVYDITNLSEPLLLQAYDIRANSILINGSYAYVTIPDYSHLEILDISDPKSIKSIAKIKYQNDTTPLAFFITDNYAYITLINDFTIFDISSPSVPILISQMNLSLGSSIWVTKNLAYIACGVPWLGSGALVIIDVSNKQEPKVIAEYKTEDDAPVRIAVTGNYAYVTWARYGLRIFDLSNPEKPKLVNQFDKDDGTAIDIKIQDNLAYYLDSCYGLSIMDIKNPSNPELIDNSIKDCYRIIVLKNGDSHILFLQSGMGFSIYKINLIKQGSDKITIQNEYKVKKVDFDYDKIEGLKWWGAYLDTLLITTDSMANINIIPNTPEEPVIKLFISVIKGDNEWKNQIIDEMISEIEYIKGYKIDTILLCKRGYIDENTCAIHFAVSYDHKFGQGIFIIQRINGKWLVVAADL